MGGGSARFASIRSRPSACTTSAWTGPKSTDGGANWDTVSTYLHAHDHALYIHPANTDLMIAGNDGGVYRSSMVVAWSTCPPRPPSLYLGIYFPNPAHFYGGAQDNGTWRTTTGAVDDWEMIYGGDGFVTCESGRQRHLLCGTPDGNTAGSNGAKTTVQPALQLGHTLCISNPETPTSCTLAENGCTNPPTAAYGYRSART